jgi:hypothetical protein
MESPENRPTESMESESMESIMTPEILQAMVAERYRLEALLHSNPVYQRLEAVRRVIDLWARVADDTARVDPVASSDRSGGTVGAHPVPKSDHGPTTPPSDPPITTDPPVKSHRGGWTRGNSQRSRILTAAAEHFRETKMRATGREIYEAITSKGIQVRGKKPQAVVAANLSSSHLFDRSEEGYGLSEWSNGGARR